MTNRLKGKVALVMGGAVGIGSAIARRFVLAGADIAIADVQDGTGSKLAEELGGIYIHADVSIYEDAEKAVSTTVDHYGRLDILVQNAGIYPWTLIENISPEEWQRVVSVNLGGCFFAARAALSPIKKQRSGRILFTSSITGPYVTSPGHGHYSATKAGINGFIRAAALEFAAYGITVNGVEPGNILTEGMKAHRSAEFIQTMAESVPLGRLGTPDDVANAFLFLASDEAAYITGTTIIVDGGQLLPEGRDFKIDPA